MNFGQMAKGILNIKICKNKHTETTFKVLKARHTGRVKLKNILTNETLNISLEVFKENYYKI